MADNETFGSKLVAIRKSMKSADSCVKNFLEIYGEQFINAAQDIRFDIYFSSNYTGLEKKTYDFSWG